MHAFMRRARALAVFTPFVASLTIMGGCGPGGDAPENTPTTDTASTDRVQAQSVLSDLQGQTQLTGQGWVATTPPLPLRDSYVATTGTLTKYYVDNVNGHDDATYDGKSPARAWKTLAYAFGSPNKVTNGAVLLRCGGVWRESISSTNSGAAKMIGAYSSGTDAPCNAANRPRIKGTTQISTLATLSTTWSKIGTTNAYELAYPAKHDRLFLDGAPLRKARHPNGPNAGAVGSEFLWKTSGTGTYNSFQIAATNSPFFTNSAYPLINAKVYIRTNHWTIERATVTAYDTATGKVTLKWIDVADNAQQGHAPIPANAAYFFEGLPWMVDSADEWAIDPQASRLVMWLPSGQSPAGVMGQIEAGERKRGLFVAYTGISPRIERIVLEGFEEDGIFVDKAPGTVINDVQVKHAGRYGIMAYGDAVPANSAQNIEVSDSYVEGAGRVGIMGQTALNFKAINNWVVDTGLPKQGHSPEAGIKTSSAGALIQGNTVQRSANAGILAGSNYDVPVVVTQNTVIGACSRVTDCGGIYTGGNLNVPIPTPSTEKPSRSSVGSLIQNNMVVDTKSATDGFSSSTRNLGMGIYLDFRSTRVKVLDNIVSGAGNGIMMHNAVSNLIDGNVVRQVSGSSLMAGWDTEFDTETQKNIFLGNVISNNSFVSEQPLRKNPTTGVIVESENDVVYAQSWVHHTDWNKFFEGATPNEIYGNDTLVMTPELAAKARQRMLDSGELSKRTGGAVWRLTPVRVRPRYSEWATGKVGETMSVPVVFKPYKLDNVGGELLSSSWSPSLEPPAAGKVQSVTNTNCDPNQQLAMTCTLFTMGHIYDSLNKHVIVPLELTDNNNSYVLNFSIKTTATEAQKLRFAVRRSVSPISPLGFFMDQVVLPGGTPLEVEQFFSAKNASAPTETSAPAMLQFGGNDTALGKPLFIQRASLVKATVTPMPTWKEVGLHVLNLRSDAPRSVSCTPADTGLIAPIDCATARFGARYQDADGVVHQAGELVGWQSAPLRVRARSAPFLIVGGNAWRQP